MVGFVPENSNFAMCMDGGCWLLSLFQKGVPTQQRLAVLLATKIFDRVRKEKEEASGRWSCCWRRPSFLTSNSRFHHHHHHRHHHHHHHYPHPHHHHQALSRVVAVSGDITEDRLGLCPEEENLLAQTVTAILRTIMMMIVGMVMTMILLSP